ncbi:MAG: type III pantothenate kinase [Treponema sp.]|nr:type III pantothenate kinase [Spirochaetia bacterium]MDY2840473.1 type III pantothenate kinase [Treponema sp.]MDY5123532.1 type III pantothenate kinase [Treponema sp.]
MKKEITLIFDIGNTNIKAALWNGNEFFKIWRISTDVKRTGDEYFSTLLPLFKAEEIDFSEISKIILSSVVPALIGPFVIVSQRITGKKPVVINPEIYDKLPVKLPASAIHEIGTDLLCDAIGAWTKYKSACIVADFGTALSFTVIDKNATVAGVAITPGIRTAFNSLFSNTAQIPAIPLEIPSTSLGKNTIVAVQSGIVLGYKGLVESMIKQLKIDLEKETGTKPEEVKVIATGGLNSMLQPITDIFDYCDKELTLEGMVAISRII